MRFLIDAQLPPALARLLAAEGHHAEHAFDIGPRDATDQQLWDYAEANGAVIVTKDEDFSALVAKTSTGPAVVWVRVGNVGRQALLDWFRPQIPRIVEMIGGEESLIELRQLYLVESEETTS